MRLSQLYHWTRSCIVIMKSAAGFCFEQIKFSSRLQSPCFSKIIYCMSSSRLLLCAAQSCIILPEGFHFVLNSSQSLVLAYKNHSHKATGHTKVSVRLKINFLCDLKYKKREINMKIEGVQLYFYTCLLRCFSNYS